MNETYIKTTEDLKSLRMNETYIKTTEDLKRLREQANKIIQRLVDEGYNVKLLEYAYDYPCLKAYREEHL